MKAISNLRKHILAGTLLLIFVIPIPVQAQGIVYGDSVPANATINADLVLIGQNVSIDGTVNGNVFILGNQVRIDGQVNGSLIMIGQNLAIGGNVSGGTYTLGLAVELTPGAVLERDLYVLSVGLSSEKGAAIQRDLFALGLDAGLNGSVGRDLHTAIGPIQLYNGMMTVLGFEELTLKLHFELPQPAPRPVPEIEATPTTKLPATSHARRITHQQTQQTDFDWGNWGLQIAREWIVLALFGSLSFWLARQQLETSSLPLQRRPWLTGTNGLLMLVVSFNLFILAVLIGVLVFSLGLALNYIGLWQLSIALWIAAYSMLALACVALWFFIVYGTKIIAIYALFGWLSSRISPANWVKLLALLLGSLVYILLRSVPMVGWVVGVLVTAAGMGTTWTAYRTSRQFIAQPVKTAQPKTNTLKKKKAPND
jgi:hypothetical protein